MRLLLPLVATFALFLAACGGGDENEPSPAETAEAPASGSPAAAATIENRAEVEALLKAAALRLEDLPAGFTLDEEDFTTNEESAAEATGPGPTLEDLNRFGRILGYEASYSQEASLSALLEGETLSLQVTTTVYQDSDGADEAFQFVRNQASKPEFVQAFKEGFANDSGVEVRDASISPLSLAELGDDRQGYEMKIAAHSTELDQDFEFISHLVGIRKDRLIGSIIMLTINQPPSEDELKDLARTLDERLKDALE